MEQEKDESTGTATQEMGITERLFGRQDEDEHVQAPTTQAAEESKEPPKQTRDDKGRFAADKSNDEYLPIEDLSDKKVKVKIGGVEKDVTLRELQKGYQTDQYLTRKGQSIQEEFAKLQALKANPDPPKGTASQAAEPEDEFYREYIKPHVSNQNQTIEALKSELEGLKTIVAPVQYHNNLNKLDAEMKAQGYDDFLKYEGEIKTRILNMPVEQMMAFDTPQGFVSIYKDIKLAEYKEALSKSKAESKLPDQRPKPKLVSIESGSGSPTGADDSLSTINAAIKKATESGKTRDFAEVIRLKYGG